MKAININYILLGLTITLFSCFSKSITREKIIGEYKRKGSSERLIFTDTSFVFFRPKPKHNIPLWIQYDSISFGKWYIEKGSNLLSLMSPENYLKSRVELNVKEHKLDNSDTLTFIIHSPADTSYYVDNRPVRGVNYNVEVHTKSGDFMNQIYNGNGNVIQFINTKHSKIDFFTITAVPNCDFPIKMIGTDYAFSMYTPQMDVSNKFEVFIFQLTNNFLASPRFNRDFIKVISNKELEWDGIFYEKQ